MTGTIALRSFDVEILREDEDLEDSEIKELGRTLLSFGAVANRVFETHSRRAAI